MKLSDLASKPQLIKLIMDDEDILKEFNEPIEFYTWDRQPLDVFMKLAQNNKENSTEALNVIKNLILNDKGIPLLNDDVMLPTKVLLKAITKVSEQLGKS